ncbi:uncharacterized protein LOC143360917 isoform X2 [Halictus rubicundus]
MRRNLAKIVVILLLCGSGEARPQKTGESATTKLIVDHRKPAVSTSTAANIQDSSTPQDDGERQLKDLQYIDQSLRTVATQLLNVTNPEESKTTGNAVKNNAHKLPEKADTPTKEMTVNVGFGRPVNSKFSFFEASHPGHAMAITEEELEKELSSTRLITAYKNNHPTTTGGISTWILLNPPSTTMKTVEVDKKSKKPVGNDAKVIAKPTTLMERIDTTERVMEKVTLPVSTVVTVEEPTTTTAATTTTTRKTIILATKTTEKTTEPPQTTLKPPQTTVSNFEGKEAPVVTTKKVQTIRTTPKPKTATSKTTLIAKPSILKAPRPNQQARPKPATRRTTMKPDISKNDTASSAKIEKVTFRPVQMITVSKSKPDATEKPMFVTKIKASVLMNTQKTTTLAPVSSTSNPEFPTTVKTVSSSNGSSEILTKLKPVGTKSNVLKVQLKKPMEDTRIEIEPIKVNAPVLKIEKMEKDKKNSSEDDDDKDGLNISQIDLKFDFNPELTKISVDPETSTSSTTTATVSSTTKKPRHTSKRKKNKNRRRKPSTSTTTTTIAPLTSSSTEIELATLDPAGEIGIQESKIAPETKISANATKTKKKQVQKPISTQIYNFLSREVMPSFGMMSLVGLGLGLASYFLYPFGGAIARRNYEVEPKYKYNLEEYGGNYGQSEEEVLSKVLQGMTTNEDNKYPGVKDYDSYYQYQHYDGNYETTKKYDQRYSSSPMYNPENTASVLKYRNTDYRYQDAPSTPNYYERPKHAEFSAGQASSGPANRQFVVGNVPKEYPPYEEKILPTTGKLTSYEPTESSPVKFEPDINQNFNFPNPVQSYEQVQTARPEEGYEEVEITPTAVAVEHGPRSLKTKRSVDGSRSRSKRDSVIQVIPSKRELEEEKEEDLSNEILNIIDSALPGEEGGKTRRKETVISEDLEAKKRRQEERVKLAETSTESGVEASSQSTGSSTVKDTTDSSASSSAATSVDASSENNSTESSKTTEQGNVEWIDSTATPPEEQDGFSLFGFVKKVAEIKFRLGLTLLKHASEGFARYLGHVQKRINGEE